MRARREIRCYLSPNSNFSQISACILPFSNLEYILSTIPKTQETNAVSTPYPFLLDYRIILVLISGKEADNFNHTHE